MMGVRRVTIDLDFRALLFLFRLLSVALVRGGFCGVSEFVESLVFRGGITPEMIFQLIWHTHRRKEVLTKVLFLDEHGECDNWILLHYSSSNLECLAGDFSGHSLKSATLAFALQCREDT